MNFTLHIHHAPMATVGDFRSGTHEFVTLKAADDTGSVTFFFDSRSALLVWLEQAKLAAIQLPADEVEPTEPVDDIESSEIGVPV